MTQRLIAARPAWYLLPRMASLLWLSFDRALRGAPLVAMGRRAA